MKKSCLRYSANLITSAIFLAGASLFGQTQTFTASGTFTVPAGVTTIIVECWGGGGAGGGTTDNGVNSGGGGGAGGAYALKTLSVTPGTTYTVTVGGVTAGTQGPGTKGNPSWFGDISTVYAEGGAGGSAPGGGLAPGGFGSTANSIGDIVFPGGNGADGNTTISGGGGGGSGSSGAGGNASGTTGGTGTPSNGGNGGTGLSSQGNGAPGLNYSGGGSGAYVPRNKNQSGGSGAQGLVVITWSFVVFTANGSFVVPDGVNSLYVECWGGGGAGGGSTSGTYAAGGGGGGAYSFAKISVIPGNSYTVNVGTGGSGGTGNGTGGGDTWFINIDSILAKGGQGGSAATGSANGNGGTGGAAASGIGSVRYSGGNGVAGGSTNKRGGGGGSSAGTAANGTSGSGTTGGVAPAGGGNGGNGGSSNGNGSPGSVPGGAGGGSGTSASGGSGAGGKVIITWVPPVYYSLASGDPNVLSNWRTSSGYSPVNFSKPSQSFLIRNGHTMTTTASGWSVSGASTMVKILNGGTLTETNAITISPTTFLSVDNGATLNHNVNSTTIFGGAEYFGSSSTVYYGFAGSQTISDAVYGNIILASSGVKSFGTLTVYGMLSIEGTATASSSGSPIFGPSASLRYRGSVAQATGAEFPSSFGSAGGVIIDNSNGVTLTASKTISSLLSFINGKITTGTNTLIMGASSTVSGAGTGKYIYGNLQKDIGIGTVSKTFEIGDASVYAPVAIDFTGTTNGTGSILFYTTQGDHPNISSSAINPASSVNRYWTATNTGVTGFTSYSATLSFVSGDLDASADYNAFIVGNYTGGAWSYPAVGTRTSSSTQASGLTTFGALQIGNPYMEYRSAATGAWDQLSTWEVFNGSSWNPATSIPVSSAGTVTLRTPYTVTVNTNPVIDQVVIDAGATLLLSSGALLADGPGTDMSVSGTIDCSSTLTGAGSFDLLSGGTIIIKSPDGITSSGMTGNIQTSLRNFNTGANYIYNGTAAQVTGSGLPAAINNLTINNTAGVSLTGSVTLNGVLNLSAGVLTTGSNGITFQNSDIPVTRASGTITTSSATDLTFGTPGNTAGAAFSIPSGTFTTPPVINNFTINRTNTLTLNDQVLSVSGIVLCNGPLNTNGNMVLLSTVSQTALISGSGTGSVTGNVSMQRYLPSGFGYKYFSSPFQAATVAEFGDDMDLGASFTTFYRFDENRLVGGVPASGWVSYKVTTNVLNPMAGYAVNFGSNPASNTVDITGAVNNGPLSVTLYNHNQIYTTGFNLVGNPYPSPINWNAAGWTKTNIDNTIYYFKATDQYGGTYSTYNGVISSDGLATNIIPSMQGFFVHVSDGAYPVTGSLGMTNSIRINDLTHAFLKKGKAGPFQLIRIAATFADDPNSTDPAVIYFEEFATDAMDSKYDALKLMNTDVKVPNIYSMITGGRKLSINALPFLTGSSLQVSLGIRANRAGTIRFRILDIDETTASLGVYLFDAVTGISQNLLGGNEYQVTLATGEYLNRFYLNLGSVVTGAQSENKTEPQFDIYITKGILRADIETMPGTRGELILYNILGQPVIKERIDGPGVYEFSTGLKDGLYIATLISGDQKYAKKIFIRGQ